MVADLYKGFGFQLINADSDNTVWILKTDEYIPKGIFISVRSGHNL